MLIPFQNVAEYGIICDVAPHDLPLLAWSSGRNVKFRNGNVEKAKGYSVMFVPEIDVNFAMTVESTAGYHWIYAGDTDVYARLNSVSDAITPAGMASALGFPWTGGVLNGIAVLNHFGSVPFAWMTPDGTTAMVALPNWPATWRARSIRPYKNYLVALGIKKGDVDNPHLILWSHVADPGSAPGSYDVTDPTVDAGEIAKSETPGAFVDQLDLADFNILYKSDAAYLMRHVGGIDIMAIKKIDSAIGLLTPNAACNFAHNGPKHLVMGPGDIYVHDGNTSDTIFRGRMRDWLFKTLSAEYYGKSFVVHSQDSQEIYVCFPESGALRPNLALVWDYKLNTTTVKEIPQIGFAASGRIVESGAGTFSDTWASAVGDWDSDNTPWGSSEYVPTGKRVAMFSHGAQKKAFILDVGTTFNGTQFEAFFERINLPLVGQDVKGQPIANLDGRKIVTEVWPRISADVGTQLKCRIGMQDNVDSAIRWSQEYTYIVGTTEKLTPYEAGKIISIRFSVTSSTHFKFSGFDLNIIPGGA